MRIPLFACLMLVVSLRSNANYNTSSGPLRGVINLHIVAHSHDDVGWIKTPQQYFDGSHTISINSNDLSIGYANGAVQFILDSTIAALALNPDRRFVIVEQWYFRRWYEAQNPAVQGTVKSLLASKQLVFAGGGLVMHDEASVTYIDMMDQTTAGILWIAQTFGQEYLPRVVSQWDPFGHSASHTTLLASPLAGYTSTFHARMDKTEVSVRRQTKSLDYAWAPSASLGFSAMTMGSVPYYFYTSPEGYCFDVGVECQAEQATGGDNPVNDDAHRGLVDAIDDNVLDYVALTVKTVAEQQQYYSVDSDGTMQLYWCIGDDFDYADAHQNFASLDKLIHYVNLNTSVHKINAFYSTQEDYTTSKLGVETPLQLKTVDGFPYAQSNYAVWAGYFTSRPALKGFVRVNSAFFQVAKQMQAWAAPPPQSTASTNPLYLLESALGVAQHHDAISGTSKQEIAYEYARRIQQGRDVAGTAMNIWISTLLQLNATTAPPSGWAGCDLANATLCAMTEALTGPVAFILYNAQSQVSAGTPVRIPVRTTPPGGGAVTWAVLGPDGVTPIPAQLVPMSVPDVTLRTVYYGAPSANMSWCVFYAPPVPAVGFTTVFLQPVASASLAPETSFSSVRAVTLEAGTVSTLSNGVVTLTFADNGLLSQFASTAAGVPLSLPLTQTLMSYSSSLGDTENQASGAYILRVNKTQMAYPIAPSNVVLTLVTGPIVNEAQQVFASWASQIIRLYSTATFAFDLQYMVGPVPVNMLGGQGVEVISRITAPSVASNGVFYTDSNGREWQRRVRNKRPDFNITIVEPVNQNYYPINTAIRILDASNTTLTWLTDRTHGGSSLVDGQMEMMIHRRLTADDNRGVMEVLSEPGLNGKGTGLIVRGTHTLQVSSDSPTSARRHRAALQSCLLPLELRGGVLPGGVAPAAWVAQLQRGVLTSSLLAAPLPDNVFLVTLHALNKSAVLVRLAHLFEAGEDSVLSSNVTLALGSMFSPSAMRVMGVVEMTLTGGEPLANVPPTTYKLSTSQSRTVGGVGVEPLVTNYDGDDRSPHRQRRNMKRDSNRAPLGEAPPVNLDVDWGSVISVTLPIVPPAAVGPAFSIELAAMQVRTFVLSLAGAGSEGDAVDASGGDSSTAYTTV